MARRSLPQAVVPATRDWERTTFGPFGRRVMLALAEVFFTDPDDPADRSATTRFAWLVDDVDHFLAQSSAQLRTGVRVAAFLVEMLPLFFVHRFARCSNLPLDVRERYLRALEASKVPYAAVLCVMFKTLMTILYFEHPEAAPHLGYDGVHARFRGKKGVLVT